jgi:hypothetical protein
MNSSYLYIFMYKLIVNALNCEALLLLFIILFSLCIVYSFLYLLKIKIAEIIISK